MAKKEADPTPDFSKHSVLAWTGADYGEVLVVLAEVAGGKGDLAERAGALAKRLAPK